MTRVMYHLSLALALDDTWNNPLNLYNNVDALRNIDIYVPAP